MGRWLSAGSDKLVDALVAGEQPATSGKNWGPPQRPARTREIRYPLSTQLNGQGRPDLFDPALRHHNDAFRTGDPIFSNDEDRRRWYAARASVLAQMLSAIAGSPWRDKLVLRGSVLLHAYLGDGARPPGDIDWIVLPPELKADDPAAVLMLRDLATLLTQRRDIGPVRIHFDRVAHDDIWAYERAEGRRMTIVWSLDDLPEGQIQLDFVFCEALPQPPATVEIPLNEGEPVSLLGATAELSLAWKLVWLQTDMWPQGKDLYDAVLLAERCTMPLSLFVEALSSTPDYRGWPEGALPEVGSWSVDWDNFRAECPWVEGDVELWKQRLTAQLIVSRG
ncbi:nucleotidyl transferase AbiEii/AbiGii toxin family protein [Lysobacter enzymogenes]|uniref:nucleotidyl transferase AbiEii/AbiGii toxin family protein n=1 Tax=Lysobacter enzymogenes TaxID=69 RepID=UPI001A9680E1|nr:nucleotidyl transferase AbiEii/AbiGii toxin family protein [Lysobacter enzymogenes]QQP97680.1 nucleotidyl transferase AbiEii/AbiGii toxin family protein [Lysobacter enzymogenes]